MCIRDRLWYDENGNLKLVDSDGHCINEHRYNELKTVKVSKDNIYLMYKNRISVLTSLLYSVHLTVWTETLTKIHL